MIPHRLRVRETSRLPDKKPDFRASLRLPPGAHAAPTSPCSGKTGVFVTVTRCDRECEMTHHRSFGSNGDRSRFLRSRYQGGLFLFFAMVDASTDSFARKPKKPDSTSGRASEEGKSARGRALSSSSDHSINRARATLLRARRIRGARARASEPFPRPTPRRIRCPLRAFRADPQARSPGTRT